MVFPQHNIAGPKNPSLTKIVNSTVILGDCLDVLKAQEGQRLFDAVVTDPPAGIGMNSTPWDSNRGGREEWVRWLAARLAAARWCCRPGARMLCWSYPRRAHWTGMAIEDAGWEIEDLVTHLNGQARPRPGALGPGWEGWWLARDPRSSSRPLNLENLPVVAGAGTKLARKPRNVLLDQGGQMELLLGAQGGARKTSDHAGRRRADKHRSTYGNFKGQKEERPYSGDVGSVARYFQILPHLAVYAPRARFGDREISPGQQSQHPTAKSPALLNWLITLVSGPGDLVADPFMGSGTTGQSAIRLGRAFWGCEQDVKWYEEAQTRLKLSL